MESPFANFQPLESGELSSERRRSGPVEHISPLFERMILESSQDKPHTDGEEPVKRKLGFEAPQRSALVRAQSKGSSSCKPAGLEL